MRSVLLAAAVLAVALPSAAAAVTFTPGDAFRSARQAWVMSAYPPYATYATVVCYRSGDRAVERKVDRAPYVDFAYVTHAVSLLGPV